MSTFSFSLLLLLAATACLSKPLDRHDYLRHDFGGNGIPASCFRNGACTAHWVPSANRWSTYRATSGTVATVSKPVVSTASVPSTHAAVSSPITAMPTSMIATTKSSSSFSPSVTKAFSSSVPSSSSTTKSSTTVTTSSAISTSTVTTSNSTVYTIHGRLPSPAQFKLDKYIKWNVTYIGNLSYTDQMQAKQLDGDKCRTGKVGDKVIWSCGDMECRGDWSVCGFSGGAAFYGTDDVMVVNTTGVVNVNDNNFLFPWIGDGSPTPPQSTWGMDTSNVAPINDTHGVAYGFEIWRGASDGSFINKGNSVASITLGPKKPIATRMGSLLTGPTEIQLGMLAILRDGNYIYSYSMGGPSNFIVGRVPADDSVFDNTKYEFLLHNSSTEWVTGIPTHLTTTIGMTTANPSGQFGCQSYGSAFYSEYLQQYVIICSLYLSWVNMYISDTPYGPWSAEYGLMSHTQDPYVLGSYGSMVHPEYSNTNELYMSMGPNNVFNMFKIKFDY